MRQCEFRTMDFLQILLLTLCITQAFTKSRSRKHRSSSSDEGSIENLLYYKDCQRSAKTESPALMPMNAPQEYTPPSPPPPRQPDCPFPKMCCSFSCNNDCGSGSQQMSHMQYQPPMDNKNFQPPVNPNQNSNFPSFNPMGTTPVQPLAIRRKKRVRIQPNNIQSPPSFPMRRDMSGLTKERIKGLIAQDDDIRKILKDLVRVTMQKVDLQDMLKSNQNIGFDGVSTARAVTSMMYEMDDYVE